MSKIKKLSLKRPILAGHFVEGPSGGNFKLFLTAGGKKEGWPRYDMLRPESLGEELRFAKTLGKRLMEKA